MTSETNVYNDGLLMHGGALVLDGLVTVRNAAVQSGVPRSTIYRFIATGKVIPIIVDGIMFLRRDDVAYLANRKTVVNDE